MLGHPKLLLCHGDFTNTLVGWKVVSEGFLALGEAIKTVKQLKPAYSLSLILLGLASTWPVLAGGHPQPDVGPVTSPCVLPFGWPFVDRARNQRLSQAGQEQEVVPV